MNTQLGVGKALKTRTNRRVLYLTAYTLRRESDRTVAHTDRVSVCSNSSLNKVRGPNKAK